MPKLFADNAPITISQGKTSDCYLLALLDCLFNAGPEGLALIQSLFVENEDSIIVRIKRSDLSKNLNNKNTEKYRIYYDEKTDEDVFVIEKNKFDEIINEEKSVNTNSFAVKILERICPYYFYNNDWQQQGTNKSIEAHKNRQLFASGESPFKGSIKFLAQWLSLDIKKINTFDSLIALKIILPNLPVYLSMNRSKTRHSYRFDSAIFLNNKQPETIVLVNPHNNQLKERHLISEIHHRNPSMYFIKTQPSEFELACCLVSDAPWMHLWISAVGKLNELLKNPNNIDTMHETQTEIDTKFSQLLTFITDYSSENNLTSLQMRPLQKKIDSLLEKIQNRRLIVLETERLLHPSIPVVQCTARLFGSEKTCIDTPLNTAKNPFKPALNSAFKRVDITYSTEQTLEKIQHISLSFDGCNAKESIEDRKTKLISILNETVNKDRTFPSKISDSFFMKPKNERLKNACNDFLSNLNQRAEQALINLKNTLEEEYQDKINMNICLN